MSSDRRRLNLSLSMQSPQQREAWKVLRAIPLGQRTDAVCRMVCRAQEQEALCLREIYPGHFVRCTEQEAEQLRKQI